MLRNDNIKKLAVLAEKIEKIVIKISKVPTAKDNFKKALDALWANLDKVVENLYGVESDPILGTKVRRDDRV